MLKFNPKVPIDSIVGSVYNPRKIEDEAIDRLSESIARFGMVKPLIVNETDNTIVAGHQRHKAAKRLGYTDVPCVFIKAVGKNDEIFFNLMHNMIETSDSDIRVKTFIPNEYAYCKCEDVNIVSVGSELAVSSDINRLLSQYDEWGSVVVDERGKVILNAEYAYCAKMGGYGLLVYCIKDDDLKLFIEFLSAEYGKYHFGTLGIKTYHQFMAQPKRLSTNSSTATKSLLYENYVIPNIGTDTTLIDIGAGRMKYPDMLKSKGFKMFAYEPSLVKKGSYSIDIPRVISCIRKIEKQVESFGLFDVCILEAVINSVADNDFEKAVLIACNSVLKKEGVLITCTRNLEEVEKGREAKKMLGSMTKKLYYMDDDNYSVGVTNGIAFLQKFHTEESYSELLHKYFEEVKVVKKSRAYIYCIASKPRRLDPDLREEYLNKEFNIEYPGGYYHNSHGGLVKQLMEKVGERDA